MFVRLSSKPLVATIGVNEWPEPATRAERFCREASRTSAANSSSDLGSALCRAMNDWLPTQLRQCPPGPSCDVEVCVTSVIFFLRDPVTSPVRARQPLAKPDRR